MLLHTSSVPTVRTSPSLPLPSPSLPLSLSPSLSLPQANVVCVVYDVTFEGALDRVSHHHPPQVSHDHTFISSLCMSIGSLLLAANGKELYSSWWYKANYSRWK